MATKKADNAAKREPDEPFPPLMPLLRALRREKINIQISGVSNGYVWTGPDELKRVDVHDLLEKYVAGTFSVGDVVQAVRERLAEPRNE